MSSPVYQMLIELCEYNKLNPDGMKKITNDEWDILLHEIDMASLGFVERLSTKYEYLLEEDIRFCCLVRLDFKYADIASLWGCTLQSPNQKIPDRKTKCVIKTHINIKQNVIFGAKLKPV